MTRKQKQLSASQIIAYLGNPSHFERMAAAYPDIDIDIAIDLLHDKDHQLHRDTCQFMRGAIIDIEKPKEVPAKPSKPKTDRQSAKSGFKAAGISKKKWLAIQSACLGIGLVKFSGRMAIEKIPAAAAGLTIAALGLGNLPDADPHYATNALCAQDSFNLCAHPNDISRLSHDYQTVLTGMIKTSDSANEQRAISAIAQASAQNGTDMQVMMIFAFLESSMGKNLSAETSSAEGIFQYVENTWMESFRKHAANYDPAYADMADSIYYDADAGYYKTNPPQFRDEILALRIQNPELHSHITSKDMNRQDRRVLTSSINSLGALTSQQGFINAAETIGMEVAASTVAYFYQNARSALGFETESDRIETMEERKREAIIDRATNAYFYHFLGATGGARFIDINESTNGLRDVPVRDLVDTETMAVSQAAINQNQGIFNNGDRTTAEVYDEIRNRADAAMQLIETRVEMASQMPDTVIAIEDEVYTTAPDTSLRPKERPRGADVLARN